MFSVAPGTGSWSRKAAVLVSIPVDVQSKFLTTPIWDLFDVMSFRHD